MNRRRVGAAIVAVAAGLTITTLPAASGSPRTTARPSNVVTFSVTKPVVREVKSPLEPIHIQKIRLPRKLHEASTPVFTRDGKHLLFFSGLHLWRIATNGHGLKCLSCGLTHQPTTVASEQEGFATELPDRKRVFFGATTLGMLQCHPSVVHCKHRKILPIDLSGARPSSLIPPGGADLLPALDEGGGSSPKISPDGHFVAFSDVTTDSVEMMTIARLRRKGDKYVATDPHVVNPPGPSSPTSTNTNAWSNSSALFEFKTFADGGADITYAQVGGAAGYNPDVWQVNLKTGQRHRVTANPDWDEDDAPAPNGKSILVESDRTMHRVDMLGGLLPVRGFIDAPIIGVAASYYVAGPIDRQCDLQPWLFPASGDHHATLMGEPIQPYRGRGPLATKKVHAANNVSGYAQWSPNGTELALNTESFHTDRSADYLLIAHLVSRQPTKPDRIVSSKPGNWAPTPTNYHGAIGATSTVVLPGHASGTATVAYGNVAGVVSGTDSIVYDNYSDNGRDVVNGTTTLVNPSILTGPLQYTSHLTMSGKNRGSADINLTFSGTDTTPVTVSGTAKVTYDGTTVTGPPHTPAPCPKSLPRMPRLSVSDRLSRAAGARIVHVRVQARIKGDDPNEAATEVAPVRDATVRIGHLVAHTNRFGGATLRVRRRGPLRIRAIAGETLRPVIRQIR